MQHVKKYKQQKVIFNNVIQNYFNNKDKKENIGNKSIKKCNNYIYLIMNKIKSKKKLFMKKHKY